MNINEEFKRLLGIWLQKRLDLLEPATVLDYREYYRNDTIGPYGCETCGYGSNEDPITEIHIEYFRSDHKGRKHYTYDGTTGDLILELSTLED